MTGGIRASHPISITPRRYISTVEGGASVAHTAFIGWTKPVTRLHPTKSLKANNRTKTELHATAVCGPLTHPKDTVVLATCMSEHVPPHKTSLHLPKENVMRGGTSLSKNSPTVVKMDRSFRNTFGAHQSPYASPRATRGGEGDATTPQRQALLVDMHVSEPAWIGDEVPRMRLHETLVESPRMQRLVDQHPNIHLDRRPSRLPCSLHHQPATLIPYKTDVVPHNSEFLWVHTDPDYKFRTHTNSKRIRQPPTITSLRQEKPWDRDNLAVSRDMYTKQMGIPKLGKLETTQNGYFDTTLISLARAELLFKEREYAKNEGLDRLMEKARHEFATLKAEEHRLIFEERFEQDRLSAEAVIGAATADLNAVQSESTEDTDGKK